MSRSVTVARPPAPSGARYRRAMAPNRAFDFLYDPLYTLSSERDHAQATIQAHLMHDEMRKMPEFKAMFSNLIHYSPYSVQLEEKNPVPPFIDRRWRGKAERRLEAFQRLAISQPSLQIPRIEYEDPEVSGRNRWKYFERPFIPFHKPIPLNIVYAVSKPDPFTHQALLRDKPAYLISRTVGTQTDYRDGEAQTDPYSPEYVVPSGSIPELLTLATLTWGELNKVLMII
ncbi:cilia- and flagella-associated protein 91-like [Varanus komodoensis]|uniref:cilia- and flagella-associated protein 91-like n=1 Tax=Varanus komodoensis TaxID=61221 RepID=UPI001CF78B00|nr:cilia- and flagella-associated protein 91-like [Varanus komodoensis]